MKLETVGKETFLFDYRIIYINRLPHMKKTFVNNFSKKNGSNDEKRMTISDWLLSSTKMFMSAHKR